MDERKQAFGPDIFLSENKIRSGLREQMIDSAINDYINGGSIDDLSYQLNKIDGINDSTEPDLFQIN